MNILKGFASVLICIAIVILLEMLTFSISLKHVFQNQIIGGAVKEKVLDNYIKDNSSIDKEKVESLIKDNKSNEIIDNVINDYMKYMDDSNYEISDKTIDSIIDFCLAHKSEIEKISGREVPESEIKSDETRQNISKSLNSGFKEFGENFGETEKSIIKSYGNFTSSKFRILVIVAVVILLGLLALLKWSTYKWLSSFGVALIISGISILMLYAFIKKRAVNRIVFHYCFWKTVNMTTTGGITSFLKNPLKLLLFIDI